MELYMFGCEPIAGEAISQPAPAILHGHLYGIHTLPGEHLPVESAALLDVDDNLALLVVQSLHSSL